MQSCPPGTWATRVLGRRAANLAVTGASIVRSSAAVMKPQQPTPAPKIVGALNSQASTDKDWKTATAAVDAPGPIVLVNSFASGGALFSVALRATRGDRRGS